MQVGNMESSCYSLQTECFGELSPGNVAAGFNAGNGDREDSWHLSVALPPSCHPWSCPLVFLLPPHSQVCQMKIKYYLTC